MDYNATGTAASTANRWCLQIRHWQKSILAKRGAVAPAETLQADALIIDEKMGRREAERRARRRSARGRAVRRLREVSHENPFTTD